MTSHLAYLSAMAQAKRWLSAGLITAQEYAKIDTMMLQRYGLSLFSIYRDMALITGGFRGNMPHCKED